MSVNSFRSTPTTNPHSRTSPPVPSRSTHVGMVIGLSPLPMQRMLFVTDILADHATRKRLAERFHSEHANIFPADIQNCPNSEFLDRCAVVFQCAARGSVYHLKDAESHGVECPRSSLSPWTIESSIPAKRNTIALVLNLLKILELSQDLTMTSATETLKDVRFVCLCGDPRYESRLDFQVGTSNLTVTLTAALIPSSSTTSFPKIRSMMESSQRSLARRGANRIT
jgi:hypothetical protein